MKNQILENCFSKACSSDLSKRWISVSKIISDYVFSAELVCCTFPKIVFSLKLLPKA